METFNKLAFSQTHVSLDCSQNFGF